MARSRSSFEDLKTAIATATSLTAGDDPKSSQHYLPSTPLVSFDQPVPSMAELPPIAARADAPSPDRGAERSMARPPETLVARVASVASDRLSSASPSPSVGREAREAPDAPSKGREPVSREAPAASVEDALGEKRAAPPKLPDLSGLASPVARSEKIVAWIAEATGATDVFLADSAGCPLAGSIRDAEEKLASVGVVASSVSSLAASITGSLSPLFELHIGEGPVFQLIGFKAGAGVFIVGFARSSPLTPRQAHAIRLACRHALGDTLRGGVWENE